MIEEKQNKLDTNDIGFKVGDILSDCKNASTRSEPTICFQNNRITYITSANSMYNNFRRRIGVIYYDGTVSEQNFILDLGFISWGATPDRKSKIRIMHHHIVLGLLEKALLTGDRIDICVNNARSPNIMILDVAFKN